MKKLERLGKLKHPEHGPCVRAAFYTWDGTRHVRTEAIFPVRQAKHTCHPRHPTGYDERTDDRVASVSPSCSFYSDLCRFGNFKWSDDA